jgi:methionyl-tRNA formyltransferase
MIRLAILAPIASSFYSRLVAHMAAAEPGVELAAIVVRTPWSMSRIKGEFRRDGARLIAKVRRKLVIGEESTAASRERSIGAFARRAGLGNETLEAFAAKRQIPYLKVADHNSPAALSALRAAAPDLIAFTGGGLIRSDLLSIPRLGILNCHAGILPQYRGMDVVEWPAAEHRLDDPGIGLTLHFMDTGLDTGPILLRRHIDLEKDDRFETIRERIPQQLVSTMMEGIRGLRDGTIEAEAQEQKAGRQYYVMHPRMHDYAARQLKTHLESSVEN